METSNSNLQTLADRVERLEEQYRSLKSEVVTEKFVLMDDDGKTRATLRMFEGGPVLVLYDTNGKQRVSVTARENVSAVALFDGNGKTRLTLDIVPVGSGAPQLAMYNGNGTADVILMTVDDGPSIALTDPTDGNTGVRLKVGNEGPSLGCFKDGKVLWSAT
jgi:hypothetical protein